MQGWRGRDNGVAVGILAGLLVVASGGGAAAQPPADEHETEAAVDAAEPLADEAVPAAPERSNPSTTHELGLDLGAGFVQTREDLIVPLRFLGPGLDLGLRYDYRGSGWSWGTRFRVSANLLFDRFGSLNAALDPSFDAYAHFRVADLGSWGELRLGPWLGIREVIGYYGSWDDSHLYWLGVSALGASTQWLLPLGDRDLMCELSLPFVALVTRPPRFRLNKVDNIVAASFWIGRFASDPTLTTWHALQTLTVNVTWRSRGDGFEVDPYAGLDVVSYAEPARSTMLTLWVGVKLRLML